MSSLKNRPLSSWLGNAIGVLIAVYLCIFLGSTVAKNYNLSQQINQMQTQISQLQTQKTQLAFDIQYYQTDSYRQREAKANLGLVEPGESEIILPSQPTPSVSPTQKSTTAHQSNLQQWWNFLVGKN